MINTPPATGTTLPSDVMDKATREDGRSFSRSLIERLDSPMPTAPQAFPMAICGRRMLAPSSRFNAFRQPPSSNTAKHIGLNFDSLAFARALSAITDAFFKVNVMILPPNGFVPVKARNSISQNLYGRPPWSPKKTGRQGPL